MKKETVEEFLARGGVINRIAAQTTAEVRHQMKTSSSPENRILSLDDGAHYFAENRKTKKEPAVSMKDVVDNFGLPKDIVDRLRGLDVG